MSELTITLDNYEIKKGLKLLGLNLSDLELDALKFGNSITLESRSLGEIGSVFILAAALATTNLGKTKKTVTFGDLPKAIAESEFCSGIPIYYWDVGPKVQSGLYLTVVDGKPAVRLGNKSK